MRRWAAGLAATVLLTACAGESDDGQGKPSPSPSRASTPSASVTPTPTPAQSATPTPTPTPAAAPRVRPDDVDVTTAMAIVRQLAGRIGPRPGTSPAYRRAAAVVEGALERKGWTVRRQRFGTPGGVSWGVPVSAGPSVNLVASQGSVERGRPWLLVGAHLDTVPQAPGAEDNASGVGVLVALAEALDDRRSRLPVLLVAFGSEEPRGPSDDDHHYGSRAYVESLTPAQRRSLRGMVALDRVGVGSVLPVCSAGAPTPLRAQLLAAARRAGVEARPCTGNRASDHWSFVRAGLPGVRLGSTPYAGYHSPGDVPAVIDRAQLRRTARTVAAWLR